MANAKYKNLPLDESLTAQEQLLLVRLMEECAEVQQAVAKILRFGKHNYSPTTNVDNIQHLQEEIFDVRTILVDLGL